MIRISQLKLSVNHSEEDLKKKAAKMLKLQPADIRRVTVVSREGRRYSAASSCLLANRVMCYTLVDFQLAAKVRAQRKILILTVGTDVHDLT